MSNDSNKSRRFNGEQWFRQQMTERVEATLDAREAEFLREHGGNPNGQLLEYLRQCARELGHTPQPCEILGSALVLERFSDWDNALRTAGLTLPQKELTREQTGLYRDEWKRQHELYKQERDAAKAIKRQRYEERMRREAEERLHKQQKS